MAEGGERVHPAYFHQISEPVSPSERSTATGYSYQSNFLPIKAHTTPGYVSPVRPPPTVIGRPPRRPPNGKKARNCCRCFLITSCSILFFLIFAIGLAALILWLLYNPKIPQYSVQDVRITSLNVTTGNASTTGPQTQPSNHLVLNTDILFTVLAKNPNHKIKIDYKRVNILTSYGATTVGMAVIPGWFQDVVNTTTVYADIHATNAPLTDSEGATLQADIKGNNVPLHARIDTRAAIKIGSWLTPSVWIHVDCNFQVSPPSAPGGAKLLNKSCKWKWKG